MSKKDYVLRPIKVAPSNATTTAEPVNGVVRDVKPLPAAYITPNPDVVDAAAEQYRTAILCDPLGEDTEYLVWAANSSSLALIEDDSWAVSTGTVSIPDGTNVVIDTNSLDLESGTPVRRDGSSRLVVVDNGGKSISKIISITIIRGDDSTPVTLTLAGGDFTVTDPESGLVRIEDNATTQALLQPFGSDPPSVSKLRGDTITDVQYVIAAARFWWTRNDRFQTRFGWNGKTQRWEPFKGQSPVNLGALLPGETYSLTPRLQNLTEGTFLPGSTDADRYATIRLGTKPDSSSTPIAENALGPFSGVLVVSDESAANTYDFSTASPPASAVVGVTNGILQWNQDFVDQNAGQTIWYIIREFSEDFDGVIGDLIDANETSLVIAPIPGPTDRPFISLGSRKPLIPITAETEADLALIVINEGEVGIALSTGKLVFNQADIDKADPNSPSFDSRYLGVKVLYDGVALNRESQPVKAAQPAVDSVGTPTAISSAGTLFVSDSEPLPDLGISGIIFAPDETGAIPTAGGAGLRAGGDATTDLNYTGLIRQVESLGDLIVFTKSGVLEVIEVVDLDSEIPLLNFQIPEGTVYIAREDTTGSRIELGTADRAKFDGEFLYFLQSDFTPALYLNEAKVYSRLREPFSLDGTEVLEFAIDGVAYQWTAVGLGAGLFTAAQIAADIDSVILGTGSASASTTGFVVLSADDPASGSVEIGFGNPQDLSGPSALGFLPGWRIDTTAAGYEWLPDSGISLGLFRSPVDLLRENDTPDFKATNRFDDIIIGEVAGLPFVFLQDLPLRDFAGYDEDVFFRLTEGSGSENLENFSEIQYRFEEGKFAWIEQHTQSNVVTTPTVYLGLGRTNVIEETLLPAFGGGLFLSDDGGPLVEQTLGLDYLVDEPPGNAILVTQTGSVFDQGARGSFSSGSALFVDPVADFVTSGVQPDYKLEILSGEKQGLVYNIVSVVNPTTLEVDPAFDVDSGTTPVSWRILESFGLDVFDSALIADVVYVDFNHLPEETFVVKLLSSIGTVPIDITDQNTNPRIAIISDAIESGRPIGIRIGLEGPTFSATYLGTQELGTVRNSSLFVPGVGTDRFNNQAFSIRVGSQEFTHGTDLTPVAAFTSPIPAGQVEYLIATGEIGFAADLLSDFEFSSVFYIENFLPAAVLGTGETEIDPATGEVRFSQADFGSGETAYFVERMITENRLDVSLSPLIGTFGFKKPLRSFHIVEAEYFQADSGGNVAFDDDDNPIFKKEFLPLTVQAEILTRIDQFTYSFNPTLRTVFTEIEPIIYVDHRRQNYGSTTAVPDYQDNVVRFTFPIDAASEVTMTYSVLEAFGGESSYTTSLKPVYRPPFFIEAEVDSFGVITDRTADFEPGKLFRVGNSVFYITASSYAAASDITTVEFYPSTTKEVGSRSPGNDIGSFLSSIAVTQDVDGNTVNAAAPGGFMLDLNIPYEPTRKGGSGIRFQGDLTSVAVAGKSIEVGGDPYVIKAAELTSDNQFTDISLVTPLLKEYASEPARISARPIYPTGAILLFGPGAIALNEPVELVVFRDGEPGEVLTRGLDYDIDGSTGKITLTVGIQPGERYYLLRYTAQKALSPTLVNGNVILPRYRATFSHVTIPSLDNGYLGGTLRATYTYSSPDSFFFRTVLLEEYQSEVAEIAEARVSTPSGGPLVVYPQPQELYEFGTLALEGQVRNIQDQDRAARGFLDFFNTLIVNFEQIIETIDGSTIGQRDGKFRFFVGKGLSYPTPGYEDDITGLLTPRNVYARVFSEASPFNLLTLEDDYLFDPRTATIVGSVFTGFLLNLNSLSGYIEAQKPLIKNDVDDRILVGRGPSTILLTGGSSIQIAKGIYKRMSDPHVLSRIFPEQTETFTTTIKGIGGENGDPGVYAYSTIDPLTGLPASTFGQPIATLSNPVLGTVENIIDAVVSPRLARGRVWDYFPTGLPQIGIADPCMIVSMVGFADFPIDPTTGFPDFAQLSANGGDVADLTTGLPLLSLPPFEENDPFNFNKNPRQIVLGKPDGTILEIGGPTVVNGARLESVYIDQIIQGCIVTFRTETGTLANNDDIKVLTSDLTVGVPWSPERGDTLFLSIRTGSTETFSDPPTIDELGRLAANLPSYRNGVDVEINKSTGEVLDITQPDATTSPVSLKDILGQNPPQPETEIQGVVTFTNGRLEPLQIPALLGQNLDDSGDLSLPYLSSGLDEITLLKSAANEGFNRLKQDYPFAPSAAAYPDEFHINDGFILGALDGSGREPAVLYTTVDVLPVTNGGFVSGSGVADLTRYDLLLMQSPEGNLPDGAEGILSVGEVVYDSILGESKIEPPRFITQSNQGERVRYDLENAFVIFDPVVGISPTEVGGTTTVLTLSSPIVVFNDGASALPVGGLNNIVDHPSLPFPNFNTVTINLFDKTTGLIVETIDITEDIIGSGLGVTVIGTPVLFGDVTITIPSINIIPPGLLGGSYNFTISILTFGGLTDDGSFTAYFGPDRLSFFESVDLRSAAERGSVSPVGGVNVQTQFTPATVTGQLSDAVFINSVGSVNGGDPLTFLRRDNTTVGTVGGGIGTFTPAAVSGDGTELGRIKAMGWEGDSNTPIVTTGGITLAAVPGTTNPADIMQGTAICQGGLSQLDNRLTEVSLVSGNSIGDVMKGDVVTITESGPDPGATFPAAIATTKAGTYLVRHVVLATSEFINPGRRDIIFSQVAGIANDLENWADFDFPLIASATTTTLTIVNPLTSVPNSPSGHIFPLAGRVFYILDATKIFASNPNVYAKAVHSAAYTNYDAPTKTFQGLSDFRDAVGDPISGGQWQSGATPGLSVSGMTYLPIETAGKHGLPDEPNNIVGLDTASSVYGFFGIEIGYGGLAPFFGGTTIAKAPAADALVVVPKTPTSSENFISDVNENVYPDVPDYLDMSNLTNTVWDVVNNPQGHATSQVDCLLPGSLLSTSAGGFVLPGFYAQAGIFLEPSFPKSTINLADGAPKIVDASHSLNPLFIGMRDYDDYVLAPIAAPEYVFFEVRRTRRFGDAMQNIGAVFGELLKIYELRRGVISNYTQLSNQQAIIECNSGTNCGFFDDPTINISVGDIVRILDSNGDPVEEIEIAKIQSPTELVVVAPGITKVSPIGADFEIYLKQAPVPQEQSAQELFQTAFTRIFSSIDPDFNTNDGGYVETTGNYSSDINILKDTAVDGTGLNRYDALGILEGDFLIIDPQGDLNVPGGPTPIEHGQRPEGDRSVITRVGPYVAGKPSELDDNRGFYKITGVGADNLEVSGSSNFAGDLTSGDVVFETTPGTAYTVYPTIHDSGLNPGGVEGQMDLRPTSYAGQNGSPAGSFAGNDFSIAPFKYQVVRPMGTVSEATQDLILMNRERMLSWIDILKQAREEFSGTYYVFQRDEYIKDINLGIITNTEGEEYEGLVDVAPFANTTTALSILDRRFWILDFDLDVIGPGPEYANFANGVGRPVLPDRINSVLDQRERLREFRLSWLDFRTNRIDGTIIQVDRKLDELERQKEQQKKLTKL